MGSAGPETINSDRLLATPAMETARWLSFVTTTVTPALFVFTATDPKLSELGATPTAASAGMGLNAKAIKDIPRHRHTNSVLFMSEQSFVFLFFWSESRAAGGGRRAN
jgi:hypothetical protein